MRRWFAEHARLNFGHYLWPQTLELGARSRPGRTVQIEILKRILELDPRSDQAHLELAGIYLRDHHLDDAEREYIALLEIKPGSSSACHGLGVIAIECGDEDAAVRNLDRAIELDPHDARPLIDRAKLELSRGRPESGLHFLDQAGSIDAGEPEVHYQRSLVLTRLGRPALARSRDGNIHPAS